MALETKRQQRVVCAAIKTHIGQILCSPRHTDQILVSVIMSSGYSGLQFRPSAQGFVDNFGKFLSRTEAWEVATVADQILYRVGGDEMNGGTLYSENLY